VGALPNYAAAQFVWASFQLGNGNCKGTMEAHVEPKALRAAEMPAHELEARRHLAELEVIIDHCSTAKALP
jgi:hypothetical protein